MAFSGVIVRLCSVIQNGFFNQFFYRMQLSIHVSMFLDSVLTNKRKFIRIPSNDNSSKCLVSYKKELLNHSPGEFFYGISLMEFLKKTLKKFLQKIPRKILQISRVNLGEFPEKIHKEKYEEIVGIIPEGKFEEISKEGLEDVPQEIL